MFASVFVHNQNDYWALAPKFYIDYGLKHIVINSDVTVLNIKADIYKVLKQMFNLRGNSQYAYPIRTIGGDALPNSQFAGDSYFMINEYRIVYDPTKVKVTGILNSDDFDTPWISSDDFSSPVYPATVSNLAIALTADLTSLSIPTAIQNADAVRTEITAELSNMDATVSSRATEANVDNIPTAVENATAVRTELAPELSQVINTDTNLTAMQLKLLELWKLAGLDAANPMTVTPTLRTVDAISQVISGDGETTSTVTRQ